MCINGKWSGWVNSVPLLSPRQIIYVKSSITSSQFLCSRYSTFKDWFRANKVVTAAFDVYRVSFCFFDFYKRLTYQCHRVLLDRFFSHRLFAADGLEHPLLIMFCDWGSRLRFTKVPGITCLDLPLWADATFLCSPLDFDRICWVLFHCTSSLACCKLRILW